MNKRFIISMAAGLSVLLLAGCQSFQVVPVSAPGINSLLLTNGLVTMANFTTNIPPFTTNPVSSLSGFLETATFTGAPGTQAAGQTGFEYRLALQNLSGARSVTINSMTLNFSPYSTFTYGGSTNGQAWVVTSGGPGSTGPTTATQNGTQVTFNFNPALTITGPTNKEVSTYLFGMLSPTPAPAGDNAWVHFTGSEEELSGTNVSFNFLMLRARTP